MKNKMLFNKALIVILLTTMVSYGQEFKKPLQEYKVNSNANISINASYVEIEIEEWNKNKVEILGVMHVDGLEQEEAKKMFDSWNINVVANYDEVSINSRSFGIGDGFFFLHNDKYLGNLNIDIPEITEQVMEGLDSIQFVMPEIENFPDLDFEFDFDFDADTIVFDFEQFKNDEKYLKQWQEKNKIKLKELTEKLKNSEEFSKKQEEYHKKYLEKNEKKLKELEKKMKLKEKEINKLMFEKQAEINKIIENRKKIKIKKILKIKVPKNAKMEMDVDFCKITEKK